MSFNTNTKQRLTVCLQLLKGKKTFNRMSTREMLSNARFVVLEHALEPVAELIELMADHGAEIHTIILKPYTISEAVVKRFEKKGANIVRGTYKEIESQGFLEKVLAGALDASAADGKKIVIMEVGGYFAKPLAEMFQRDKSESLYKPLNLEPLVGVVEDTTFGHNRYLESCKSIDVPIYSVARSSLKEIEARFVGNMALIAVDRVFRELGISLAGRRALVLGYGMIGKNVARSARSLDLTVSIYDKDDHRNLRAFSLGYRVHQKKELLPQADIIFAATGNPEGALSFDEIQDYCKNMAVLASVGSKDVEFDIDTLRAFATEEKVLNNHLVRYTLPTGNDIHVINNGVAVNFTKDIAESIPTEVMDLVFAEMLQCSLCLLFPEYAEELQPLHSVLPTPTKYINRIAHDWLRNVNYGRLQ